MGTACLFMAQNPIGASSAFNFTAIPMSDIAIMPNAVFHTTSMSARDVMEKYPTWTPPKNIQEQMKQDPETPIKLVQSLVGTEFTAWLDVDGDGVHYVGSFRWVATISRSLIRSSRCLMASFRRLISFFLISSLRSFESTIVLL